MHYRLHPGLARVFALQVARRQIEQVGTGFCAHSLDQHLLPHAGGAHQEDGADEGSHGVYI